MVQVSILAQDKKGDPVTGLTKDDFTLIDGGQPQQIAYFSEETTRLYSAGILGTRGATPAANTFTNRYEEKTGVPTSVTVILLDALNTHSGDIVFAREQVAKFLNQLQPQDRVALYVLADRVVVLHEFTSDASSLLRALNKSSTTDSARLTESEAADIPSDVPGGETVNQFLDDANQRVADFFNSDRAVETAKAIQVIANHLAGLPGRKNLIWVSASFPFQIGADLIGTRAQSRSFSPEILEAEEALNNANMAIYPVDARGLIAPPMTVSQPGPRGNRRGGYTLPPASSPRPQNFDTMNVLAERTGGRAFYNTNDLKTAVRQAVDDSRVTYVLGYYPSHDQWNGKFREIKVESKRPGLRLRFRRGYFAIPDSAITVSQKEQMLTDALQSTLESTDLGLDVQADPVNAAAPHTITMHVRVSPKAMSFAQSGDRWKDSVEFVWVELDKDGKILGHTADAVNLNVPQQSHDKILQDGLNESGDVDLLDGVAQLRLVVRDMGSGAIGSVNIPLNRLLAKATPTAH
jgi:VWFA-related protein